MPISITGVSGTSIFDQRAVDTNQLLVDIVGVFDLAEQPIEALVTSEDLSYSATFPVTVSLEALANIDLTGITTPGRYRIKLYEIASPVFNYDTYDWVVITKSYSDSDPFNGTWCGFEHGIAQRDPVSSDNLPGDFMWSVDQPGTYYDNFQLIDTSLEPALMITNEWAHQSTTGFGGQYSLRMGIGTYDPHYPQLSAEMTARIFCCHNDSTAREIRYMWYSNPLRNAGNLQMNFLSYQSGGIGGTAILSYDGGIEVSDSDANTISGTFDFADNTVYEWKWTIVFATAGSIKLEINNVLILEGTGNFSYTGGASEGLGSMLFTLMEGPSPDSRFYIDDFICFPAEVLTASPKYVLGIQPASDYQVVGVPSIGDTNYSLLNEAGASYSDSEYVTLSAIGEDLYALGSFPYQGGTIWGVSTLVKQQSTALDYQANFKHTLSDRTNTVYGMVKANSIGTADNRTLGSVFNLAPDGLDWTCAKVSDLLVGFRTVDMSASNSRFSWYGVEVLADELVPASDTGGAGIEASYSETTVSLNIFDRQANLATLNINGFLWDRRRLEDSSDVTTKYETTFGGIEHGLKDGIHFDWFSSGVTSGCTYDHLVNKFIGDYKTWTPVVYVGAYNTSYHLKPLFSDFSYADKFATDVLEEDSMYHLLHEDAVHSTIRIAIYKRDKNLINPYWVFNEVEDFDGEIVSGIRQVQGLSGWDSSGNQRKKQFKIQNEKVYLNGSHFVSKRLSSTTPPSTYPQLVIEYAGQSTGQGKKLFTEFLPVQPNTVRLWLKVGDTYTELSEVNSLDYYADSSQVYEFDYDLGIATLSGYQAPRAFVRSQVLSTDTTIEAQTEDYYLDSYPQRGIIQIGTEEILYSSRTRTAFVDCIRGYNNTSPNDYEFGTAIKHMKQGADVVGQLYIEYDAVPRIDYEITDHSFRTANRTSWLDVRPARNVSTNNLLQIYPGQQNVDHIDLSTTASLIGGDLFGPIYFGADTAQLTATVYDSFGLPVDDQFVTMRLVEGLGYLNGLETGYKSITNSNGQVFADYTIPYENRFVETLPTSITHVGADTYMELPTLDTRLELEDFWIFQILKHDKLVGSVGLELPIAGEGSASQPYGSYYYLIDGVLDETYLQSLVRVEVGGAIEWKTITWLEQIFDTTNKTKIYIDSTATAGATVVRIFKKDEIQWDPELYNGARRILYKYDSEVQHPTTGLPGAYFPVHPDAISGNTLIFRNKLLPLPAPSDNTNNLGWYSVVAGHEVHIRAETIDPLTGWLKVSNTIRLSVRIPNFLLGVSNQDGIYIPHGFKLVTEEFNQGSGIGLPNFLTINPAASGINQLNLQLEI